MLIKNDCSDSIVIENQKADLNYKLRSLFINSKTIKQCCEKLNKIKKREQAQLH